MTNPDNRENPGSTEQRRVVVIGPDGQPVGMADVPAHTVTGVDDQAEGAGGPAEMIGEPAKVMRIGTMIKQLLEEVRAAPLDEASRVRLKEIHAASIKELEEGLTPELRDELERLSLPFTEDSVPSDAELRIAQAQLVGWLEGVFHGLQTAIFAQQMAARSQLEQIRRGMLPPGQSAHPQEPGVAGGTGQYL
ncbi:bacterial proteasome activator family protein [Nakamurella lactea]|uniref:bacterial proteasome activator family protein n=1 Tax=Nakamurella lactea TaxID=459515 RepID=UPI00042673B8|nr:bacterial proteasome activator family protein [Nakamurella lactea]